MSEGNPFLALFEPPKTKKATPVKASPTHQKVNDLLEDVFGFTLNPHGVLGRDLKDDGLLHLTDLSEEFGPSSRSWLGPG
jgi:hypothetical protein